MRIRKKPYRARQLKSLQESDLLESVRDKHVVVATDVAKVDMVSSIELSDGALLSLVRWKNPSELRDFVSLVVAVGRAATEVECVQEPSGTYGDPLRAALQRHGLPVYRVSPKHVHDLQEVYDSTPSSHDPKAARVIARVHRDGLSVLWEDRNLDLAAQERRHNWFLSEKTRLRSLLEARLARHWPEVGALLDLHSTTLLRLLDEYGSPAAVARAQAGARSLMRSTGRGPLAPEKIEAVLASAADSVGVPATEAEAGELKLLAHEFLRVNAELKAEKQQLLTVGATEPSIVRMQPVAGKVTAVVLFALLGDPANYDSAGAYIKAAGLNLREHSSGKKKGQLAISKRGPGTARLLLYFAAMRLVKEEPLFKEWHERKKARSGPRQGKKSIIALCRKLMAALWHVGRGATFEPSRLIAQPA